MTQTVLQNELIVDLSDLNNCCFSPWWNVSEAEKGRHRTVVWLAKVLLSSTAPAGHHSPAATSCRCCDDSWEKAVQASSGWCSEPSVQPGVQLVVSQWVVQVPGAVVGRTQTYQETLSSCCILCSRYLTHNLIRMTWLHQQVCIQELKWDMNILYTNICTVYSLHWRNSPVISVSQSLFV